MSPKKHEEIKRQVTKLLSEGVLEESNSVYNNPVLLVPKKGN